jgi:hypothetical protein
MLDGASWRVQHRYRRVKLFLLPVRTIFSDTIAAVRRIKLEINRLTEEQAEALKTATYVGMIPDEAKEYDKRRSRITELIQELELWREKITDGALTQNVLDTGSDCLKWIGFGLEPTLRRTSALVTEWSQ